MKSGRIRTGRSLQSEHFFIPTPGEIAQLVEAYALSFLRLIAHLFATAPGGLEIAISKGAVQRRDDSKKITTGRNLLCNQTVLSATVLPETVGPRQQHPAVLVIFFIDFVSEN